MKLYTKTICPKCKWVKSEIENLGLDIEEINVDQDVQAREMLIYKNVFAAPVLEIEGGELITDVAAIIEKLNEK